MNWLLKSADEPHVLALAQTLTANPKLDFKADSVLADTLARLLVLRGITDAESASRFLFPSLSHLHAPYAMAGMKLAIDRLEAAIARHEGILIYGDYDVDGTTAIVILKTAIELCGGRADFHVPHRIREGYGMRDEVIERAAENGIRLIISVDTGIRAFAAADTADRLGIDLIVTDHHLPGHDGLPRALAVVNPNQPGCDYPCKALCGAGVAFKLAQGLMERKLDRPDQSRLLTSFMKVVAIATIADAVPLVGENRVFAKLGLEALRSPVNVGLKALLEVAQLGARPLTSGEVAFRIAPRLNAAGRMDVARDVVELFSVKDPLRARQLASRLDKLNNERQEEERRIVAEIEARLQQDAALRDAYCMVIDGEGWHRGVIGITATRMVERWGRPALVISREADEAHGSGRSIRAFHLLEALESCSDLFTRYGGHSHAVGFSLPADQISALRAQLDAYARARLSPADFEPALEIDGELPLHQVTPELFQCLRYLEPFGQGNPEPLFAAAAVRLMQPPRILKDKHVKLKLAASLTKTSPPLSTTAPTDSSVAPAACPERTEGSRRLSWGRLASSAVNDAAPDTATILSTPRCHPDAAAFSRDEKRTAAEARDDKNPDQNWRRAVTFDALAWRMAERLEQEKLLAGDSLDIAFTIGNNDHPEFGGLELTVCDFKPRRTTAAPEQASATAASAKVSSLA